MVDYIKNYDEFLWRNSGYSARLGLGVTSLDARTFFPVLLILFHPTMTSVYIFAGWVGFFAYLDYIGLPFAVAMRRARSKLAGKKRYIRKTSARRKRFLSK